MAKDKTGKIIRWIWAIVVLPIVLLALLILIVWAFSDIPSMEELERPESKLATQVIAEEGEILTTYHIENRTFVSYDELAPNLVQATISTEDARFYRHSGIDFKSLARVLVKTLLSRDSSQGGGSTITQQLAKTMYPRGEGRGKLRMVWIKLREWITAVKLERNYTKEEIVDMYLNAVFFGANSYGIHSASAYFFNKKPIDLKAEESAVLVGMVNKPTRYNPVLNPDKALERRNLVLDRMCSSGYLTRHECDSIKQLPIKVYARTADRTTGVGPYFRDMLRRTMNAQKPRRRDYQFVEEFQADSLRWEDDPIYGWLNKNFKSDGSQYDLDRDGLRIYTTINYKMQVYAEQAIQEHLSKDLQLAFNRELRSRRNPPYTNGTPQKFINTAMEQARKWSDRYRMMKASGVPETEIMESFTRPVPMRVFTWTSPGYRDTVLTPDDSIRYYKSFLRAAFMAVEPKTGHIRAYVGGPDYRYFKYDNIGQGRRQVGSTVKPFLYSLAMESGMTPCDQVYNTPPVIMIGKDKTWSPTDLHADGTVKELRWGLAASSNSLSAYLMQQFGADAVVREMHKLGISSHIDAVASLCVGSCDLSVYEMVAAYNTFPSSGVYTYPMYVLRIEDSEGNVLGRYTPRRREAISETAAYKMIYMMKGVVDGGTGGRLRHKYGLKGEIAGKTGTTNDNSDGWFVGYTPTITAGVWVGGEDRYVHFNNGALGQGSNMALPIWGIWMKKVLADGTLGISADDKFPDGVSGSFCGGAIRLGDAGGTDMEKLEDYYFE